MQHAEKFDRYRVTIALRSDLAAAPGPPRVTGEKAGGSDPSRGTAAPVPELFPVTFDVWVKTKRGLEVSFMGGAAFSGLRSKRYYTKTDPHGTADTKDDTKTVEEAEDAKDGFRPDIIAVTNLRFPDWLKGFGLAFGVGMNNDSDPRFFFGPSYLFGRHVLLHAGWAGGQVDRLPNGQATGVAPIGGDDALSALPKRFAHAFYASVSFGFVPDSEKNFKSAFAGSQKPAKPADPEPAKPDAGPGPKVDLTKVAGDYVGDDDKNAKAKAVLAGTKPEDFVLTVTITSAAGVKTELKDLKHAGGVAFANAEKNSCAAATKSGKQTLQCLGADEKVLFKGTKAGE
jgi:hypothetical protein